MTSLLDWQLDIFNRLKTGLPNTPVFAEGVPENEPIVKDPSGFYKPTLIIWFGQAVDPANFGGRLSVADMCGRDGDSVTKAATFVVQVAAPTGLAILHLGQAVRDLLQGYAPAGQGELSEAGSGTVRDPYPLGVGDTLRFYLAIGFRGMVSVGKHTDTGLWSDEPQRA